MLGLAFFEPSPNEYITTPHATAQYGQVLRVSVARESLNSRTSAIATEAEKPRSARLEPASVAPVIFRNWRRVRSVMRAPVLRTGGKRRNALSLCPLTRRPQDERQVPQRVCARMPKSDHLSTSALRRKLLRSRKGA